MKFTEMDDPEVSCVKLCTWLDHFEFLKID